MCKLVIHVSKKLPMHKEFTKYTENKVVSDKWLKQQVKDYTVAEQQ